MTKMLRLVTVTGADDLTPIKELVSIQEKFPFVEFAILLSKSSEGKPRFPTLNWIEKFLESNIRYKSGHLCGRWVRDVLIGENSFRADRPTIADKFGRIQLNFHSHKRKVKDWDVVFETLKSWGIEEYIFQLDGVNDSLCSDAMKAGINAVSLFDLSGGAGILPDKWPKMHGWCGYAGGMSADNVGEQLESISDVAPSEIWIDAETRLRSDENRIFDLDLVREFLEVASEWAIDEAVE